MWSRINTMHFSMWFTTSFHGGTLRSELCFGITQTHVTAECAVQESDPEMKDIRRVKLLALASRQQRHPVEPVQLSGQSSICGNAHMRRTSIPTIASNAESSSPICLNLFKTLIYLYHIQYHQL